MGAACPRCGCAVALHEGRPLVSSTGAVELWHASCYSVRDSRPVEEVAVVLPEAQDGYRPRRHPRARTLAIATHPRTRVVVGLAATTAAAIAYFVPAQLSLGTTASTPDPQETPAVVSQLTEHEVVPPLPDVRDLHPIPVIDGTPIDELYPSLIDWIHPVTGTERTLSQYDTGMFGAEREGVTIRRECGRGHCGIDLGGPIGRAIVAVADGVVVRVEHSENGRDGRSGRYVRLEHSDGTLTSYMHLNTITRGLAVGDRVDGGQQIGTLGATGINSAAPHLHFALEAPKTLGTHGGDHVNTRYVDPAPFLVRASIIERADRRRGEKPAF